MNVLHFAYFTRFHRKGFHHMKNSKSVVFRRQQALLRLLKENRTIDVDTAAAQLDVSATTIRRDLVMFEQQHLVKRFHGGAELIEGTLKEEDTPTADPKSRVDAEQKQVIAQYAASLVEDGDTIFMNSSSTTLMMLDYIKDKRVIVVTNNSNAIYYPHDPQVTIILTGGEIYQRRKSLVGEFALQTLTKINADKAFIGVGGISVASGITTSVLPETAINEMMMRRCQGSCYVLAARQKIGREHNFLSGTIDKVDTLITCPGANADEIKNLRANGVEVIEVNETRQD